MHSLTYTFLNTLQSHRLQKNIDLFNKIYNTPTWCIISNNLRIILIRQF